MNFKSMTLSEKIKYLREKKNMTQGCLAKESGVSVAEICRIEKGERQNPSVNLLNKILKTLEVDKETYIEVMGFQLDNKECE